MAEGVDTKQRFEITVPSPKARINLGQPETQQGQPTFGYVGLTLQSDVDLFVDVNKDTFQQGSNVLHQAGGHWLQYSDGPMFLTTLATQHLASGEQLSLFAGAPYGNSTGLDHGTRVRHHRYNNLHKHYRTEEIQNGLFEFFYGRCDRVTAETGSTFAYKLGGFDRTKATAVEQDAELRGFRAMVDKSEEMLGLAPGAQDWVEELTGKASSADTPSSLEYGFSTYFSRFDPYKLTNPASLSKPSPINKLAVGARNLLAKARRLVDVMRKIGACITDNAISAQILKLAEAVAGFGRTWAAFDRVIQRHPFQSVRWVDEYNSGFEARAGAAADQNAAAGKASITSAGETFALAHGDQMTIEAPTRGTTRSSIAVVAKRARLDAAAAVATGWSGSVTIDQGGGRAKTVSFTSAGTGSAGSILAKINAGDPGLDPKAKLVSGKLRLESHEKGSAQRVSICGDKGVLAMLGFGESELPRTASGETIDAVATPSVPVDAGSLTLALDGTVAVTIDFSVGSNNASSMAALVTVINTAWAASRPAGTSSIVAQDAAGRLQLVCPGHTLTATASTRALFERLGLATSSGDQTIVSGAPTPANNAADASAVTADELAALLTGAGVAATAANGTVKLESTTAGAGSFVKGSGDMADKVGLRYEKELTGWALAKTDFGVINHELQKLPEDARNLTRPITEFLEDIESTLTNLEKTLEALVGAIPRALALDGPPAAIGLIAKDGISLGTPDRIVGAAGGGFVFIADGGTGQRDRGKWVPALEKGINIVLEWKPAILGPPDASEPPPNVGFRVCSDTTVNLMATTTAELLALGRAKMGEDVVGVGVARVGASRSVEVAGWEKVSIGARAPENDPVAANGGRIELLARDITIGAGDDPMLQTFGIHELATAPKRKNVDKADSDVVLGDRAWSPALATSHPKTKTVTIDASDRTEMRVGEWSIALSKENGLAIGWEQSDATYQARKKAIDDEVDRLTTLQSQQQSELTALGQRILVIEASLALPMADPSLGDTDSRLKRRQRLLTKWLAQTTQELAGAQAAKAAFPPTRDEAIVPVLKMGRKEIVLGFNKNADGTLEDGPHLKITPDGFWLETGKTDKEVSINTPDGKTLKVFAETAWTTQKDVKLTPTGKLGLEATGDLSLKGANVTVAPNGTVKIG